MMHISLNTAVYCHNKFSGVTHFLIVQPLRKHLTHLVVKPANLPTSANRADRLVPISYISRISDNGIWLSCTANEFCAHPPFTETHFIKIPTPDYNFLEYGFSPHLTGTSQALINAPVIKYNVPLGETMISRQVQIEAKNGHCGQFEGFIVHPKTGEIMHLVFQRGHIWDRKRETVPASAIEYFEGETIYLNIYKADLIRKKRE